MKEKTTFTMVDSSAKSTQNYLPLGRPPSRPNGKSGFRMHLVNLACFTWFYYTSMCYHIVSQTAPELAGIRIE